MSKSMMTIFGILVIFAGTLGVSQLVRHESPKYNSKIENLASEKPGGHLLIKITGSGTAAAGVALDLDAIIGATKNLTEVQYEWTIPSDYQVVSGNVSGTIGDLNRGTPAGLHLRVMPKTSEPRLIYLHVFRMQGAEANGQMAEYQTSTGKMPLAKQPTAQKAHLLSDDTSVPVEKVPAPDDSNPRLMQ